MKGFNRYISALTLGLKIILVSSCSFFVYPEVTFVIKNESSKDLKILFYEKGSLIGGVDISKTQHYESTHSFRPGNMDENTSFDGERIDSLVILFSDGRGIIQYCNGERLYSAITNSDCRPEKNVMDFNTGTTEKKKLKDRYTKTITFDESDYEKAIAL